jgi:hypothetical protein
MTKNTHLQIRLTEEEKAHIRARAKARNLSMSEYLLSLVPDMPDGEDLTAIKDPVARDMLRNWNPVTSLR